MITACLQTSIEQSTNGDVIVIVHSEEESRFDGSSNREHGGHLTGIELYILESIAITAFVCRRTVNVLASLPCLFAYLLVCILVQ